MSAAVLAEVICIVLISVIKMKTRFVFIIYVLLLGIAPLAGQSPFQLDPVRESILLGTGLTTYSAGWIYQSRITGLSVHQVMRLEDELMDLDKWAIEQNSAAARLGSDIGLGLGHLTPLVLYLSPDTKGDRGIITIMYLETMSLTLALTGWTKRLVLRPRPFTYNTEVAISKKLSKDARYSFFSGHTSMSAAACFFTASVWSRYHPDSKWKPAVWTLAASIPAMTGYFRVKSGKHFPTDVIIGYAVGAGMGLLIPLIHRTDKKKSNDMRISFGMNSIHCSWKL